MKLTVHDVQRVAELARIRLTHDEELRLTNELGKILEYMEQLNELDTSNVEPIAHILDIANAFREDRVTSEPDRDAVLANAPARHESFFKVPKIIE